MRHAMIAVLIAGCGGHSSGNSDAQMARPLAAEDIARACINAYACLAPPIDGPTLPDCLHKLDDGDTVVSIYRPEQIRCLVAAGADCTRARACLGYTYGACAPDGTHCEGDRLVDCSRGMGLTLDCRHGLWYSDDSTCVAASSPTCGIGTCARNTPERCDGTRALRCSNEVLLAFDCAQVGATCNLEGTSAQCVGSGPACTASRCDGTKLIRCAGGHEYTYQCAEMFQGGTCVDDGRSGHSCGFGPDCGETATCNGNTSQLCVLGAQISIDCVASGYAGCSLGSCLTATFPP